MLSVSVSPQADTALGASISSLWQVDEIVRGDGASSICDDLTSRHVLLQLALVLGGILIAPVVRKRLFWRWV